MCILKYCPCPLILSSTVIPRAGTPSLRPTTPARTIARNYLASHLSVESIDFLLNLRAGAEETRGRETAQPNNYHSLFLASGAIVAQGPPFSGFLNIFSWIFGRTRWAGEIGPSQPLYPHWRRRNAWCSTQTYMQTVTLLHSARGGQFRLYPAVQQGFGSTDSHNCLSALCLLHVHQVT
jgi:hypothetical protein